MEPPFSIRCVEIPDEEVKGCIDISKLLPLHTPYIISLTSYFKMANIKPFLPLTHTQYTQKRTRLKLTLAASQHP